MHLHSSLPSAACWWRWWACVSEEGLVEHMQRLPTLVDQFKRIGALAPSLKTLPAAKHWCATQVHSCTKVWVTTQLHLHVCNSVVEEFTKGCRGEVCRVQCLCCWERRSFQSTNQRVRAIIQALHGFDGRPEGGLSMVTAQHSTGWLIIIFRNIPHYLTQVLIQVWRSRCLLKQTPMYSFHQQPKHAAIYKLVTCSQPAAPIKPYTSQPCEWLSAITQRHTQQGTYWQQRNAYVAAWWWVFGDIVMKFTRELILFSSNVNNASQMEW